MAASESALTAAGATAAAPARDPESQSDIRIAGVMARALGDMSGVAALSSGRLVTAATYGPGQTVRGVVVRHHANGSFDAEVHVVASEAYLSAASSSLPSDQRPPDANAGPVLLAFADGIRARVARALRDESLHIPVAVDVYIDDLW